MATARATRSTEAPVLLLWIGVILANLSNAGRTWHIPMLAAACGPGGSLAFLLAVGLLLARTQAAGVSGGGLVMAGLAAALVANALVSLNELGQLGPPMSPPAVPVEDAGGGLAVLVRSMATAPADLMLRALSRLLYAAASVRWLSEIRPISWSSAAALGVIPSAALISCAQLAIDSAASAAAVMRQPSEGSHASHGAPLVVRAPLEQDPNFGGVTLDAIGAAVLAGACSLRVATAWFAPRSRRLPTPNGAAAAALVPASQAIEEARQLRAKLGALLPLAVAAAFALFTALGRLSFPPAALGEPGVHKSAHGAGARGAAAVVPEGSLGWMSALEGADWAAWVRLSRVLLDAAAALAVVRCAPPRCLRLACRCRPPKPQAPSLSSSHFPSGPTSGTPSHTPKANPPNSSARLVCTVSALPPLPPPLPPLPRGRCLLIANCPHLRCLCPAYAAAQACQLGCPGRRCRRPVGIVGRQLAPLSGRPAGRKRALSRAALPRLCAPCLLASASERSSAPQCCPLPLLRAGARLPCCPFVLAVSLGALHARRLIGSLPPALPWPPALSGRRLATPRHAAQAEKERILRERRARAPVIQDADGDEWEPYHGEQLARLDPSLVRDEDGDFAHEFWRAVPTGGFERAQVPGSGKAQQAAESKPAS